MKFTRRIGTITITCILMPLILAGCWPFDHIIDRGSLVSHQVIETYTPEDLTDAFSQMNDDHLDLASADHDEWFAIAPQIVRPIEMIKIEYSSVDAKGDPVQLSGLLILPRHHRCRLLPLRVPLLGLQHATQLERRKSPSAYHWDPQVIIGAIIASTGYAVAMADYPGMGDDTVHVHPYCHADSLAYSVVDMLRASREYIERRPRIFHNDQLFLMGYSEGGQITMAATKEIQLHHSDEFNLVASCPMAGPYDMTGAMREVMLQNQPFDEPFFLPYVIVGYQSVYGDLFAPQVTMKEPYDTTLPPLLDGYHTPAEVTQAMPESMIPREIMLDSFIAKLEDSDSPVFAVLEENNLWSGWTPSMPMRLYHAPHDNLVPYANSLKAYNEFHARGANVELIDLFPRSHVTAAIEAFPLGFLWLNRFKERH